MDRIPSITSPLTTSFVFAVSWMVLLPTASQGDCFSWRVREGADFTVIQSNGYSPRFRLTQNGSQLSGYAVYADHESGAPVNGSVSGSIQGPNFEANVSWPNATFGVYSGTVDGNGNFKGVTFDRLNPSNPPATWYSDQPLVCLSQTPP